DNVRMSRRSISPVHLSRAHDAPKAFARRRGARRLDGVTIPSDYLRLLELPLYGGLGTIRPDDTVQVNPMWFEYDGEHIRFTHTTKRSKYRNLQRNPSMSLCVF